MVDVDVLGKHRPGRRKLSVCWELAERLRQLGKLSEIGNDNSVIKHTHRYHLVWITVKTTHKLLDQV